MAVVRAPGAAKQPGTPRQSSTSQGKAVPTYVKPELGLPAVTLPTELSVPPNDLASYRVFIYGEGGIGKSTLVSKFGSEAGKKVIFLNWELANTGIKLYRSELLINTPESYGWAKGLAYVETLRKTDHQYGAVCFDTGSPAYERCLEYVCAREHMQHPGKMEDFGASWKKVKDEFLSMQRSLAAMGLAVTVICHDKLTEITTRSGSKIWRCEPGLSGSALMYYRENSDIIGYYYTFNNERYLQIIGDDFVMAKANPEEHFRTPAGERIHRIPMGNSPDEAYDNFMAAFRNEQTDTFAEMSSSSVADEAAARGRRKHSKKK